MRGMSMNSDAQRVMTVVAMLLVASFLSACPSSRTAAPVRPITPPGALSVRTTAIGIGSQMRPYVVTITFDTTGCQVRGIMNDPTGCASGSSLCVNPGETIMWTSDPVDIRYEIFFDPFHGSPITAKSDGTTKHKRIDADAPVAEYKYSIVKEGCDPNLANTYDPRIRVDH